MNRLCTVLTLAIVAVLCGCNLQTTRPDQTAGSADIKDLATTQQRAKLAYDAGNWPNAEVHYLKLAQALPLDAEPWFRLGNVYTRMERPADAVNAYREALIRNPKSTRTWHNLGIVQLRQATRTFVQLQEHASEDDPLGQRARYVVEAMTRIMEEGFGVTDAQNE
jgi:Flp pilus assembly protein TadD